MINFTVLGSVTASQDSWVADLSPQQQLLLARLVVARGWALTRVELTEVLWDGKKPPEGALKRVAAELRSLLRQALPGTDPLPGKDDTYRLPLNERQADVLRFRAKIAQARRDTSHARIQLLRDALREWGPSAAGLYGGHPLTGLNGIWADTERAKLRAEYRDARFDCLKHDAGGWLRQETPNQAYQQIAQECAQLANDDEALCDEPLVGQWMVAAFRSGDRTRALAVFQRAREAARRHLNVPPSPQLRRLAEMIRDDSPRLGGPREPLLLAAVLPLCPTDDRKPMREPQIVFNNSGNTKVGVQTEKVDGAITINMEPAAPVSAGDATEDPSEDRT